LARRFITYSGLANSAKKAFAGSPLLVRFHPQQEHVYRLREGLQAGPNQAPGGPVFLFAGGGLQRFNCWPNLYNLSALKGRFGRKTARTLI
jgi:hypothetical protein